MISIWRQDEKTITRIDAPEPNCWINVTEPNNYEISYLINRFGIEPDLLNDVLDIDEQARAEKDDDRLIFITRIPVYQEDREIPYYTVPLGIIFVDGMVITICLQENEIVGDLVENRIKRISLVNRRSFLLPMLFRVSFYFLRYLKEINRRSSQVEKELQKAVRNTELIQLLTMEKSLTFFTTSLKSNEFLLEKIRKSNFLNLTEEDVELIEDVVTENRQAIEMANIHNNILSSMMDAFASVISNNLNVVMKQLTSISLILMIPTLIASIYGMNIPLPFQKDPWVFLGVLLGSGCLAGVSIFIFRRKKFF